VLPRRYFDLEPPGHQISGHPYDVSVTTEPADPDEHLVVDQPGGNVTLDLFVLAERLGSLLDGCLAGSGLTPTQFAIYSQLERGAKTPGELSRILGIVPSTLSGHLATMVRAGDATRSQNALDRRSFQLALTDAGRGRVSASRPHVRRAVRAIDTVLGGADEVAAVRGVLGRLDLAIAAARDALT